MKERDTLTWIKIHLGPIINAALDDARKENPHLLYTESWIASMVMRETGFLIARYVKQQRRPQDIHLLMRGDYGQRKNEAKPQYHGYGYMQIDTGSYPLFIANGHWKDPYKTFVMAISVLEEKRKYIQSKFPALGGDQLRRAITAAYNCGQGNVGKILLRGIDIDSYTHQKNYSAEVWRYRNIYNAILHSEN